MNYLNRKKHIGYIFIIVCILTNVAYTDNNLIMKSNIQLLKKEILGNSDKLTDFDTVTKISKINNTLIADFKKNKTQDISILTDEISIYATYSNYNIIAHRSYCNWLTLDAMQINPEQFLKYTKRVFGSKEIDNRYKYKLLSKWHLALIGNKYPAIKKVDIIDIIKTLARKAENINNCQYALGILLGVDENSISDDSDEVQKPIDFNVGMAILKGRLFRLTEKQAEYYDLLLKADPTNKDAIIFMRNYIKNENPLYSDIRKKEYLKCLKSLNKKN